MNNKIIKIAALSLVLGISIPIIVTGTTSQEYLTALFPQNVVSSDVTTTQVNKMFTEDVAAELEEIKKISDDDFTIKGKWGIYDNNQEGIFKGFEEKNTIYGKSWYNNKQVYFYLQMNTYLRTFTGVIIYEDNFISTTGNYLKKEDRFIALWTCENVDGWFVGEFI
jgi:hypothetical protein